MVRLNSVTRIPSRRSVVANWNIAAPTPGCAWQLRPACRGPGIRRTAGWAETGADDSRHLAAVGQKQDRMIPRVNDRVVVGNDDLVLPHQGPDAGALGQIQFVDTPVDHLEVRESPCTMVSMASAAPRRRV
jgi:hypothetical protein